MRVKWGLWSFAKLWLFAAFGRGVPPGWVSEEEALLEDLEALDRANPGWDADFPIQNAASMLRSGKISLEDARVLFDQETLAEALRRNEATLATPANEGECHGQK